jgi:hypothetical protein
MDTAIDDRENTQLAAQTHFGLAGLYRKEGKVKDAEREMQNFCASIEDKTAAAMTRILSMQPAHHRT